jgi:CRP-like cAMP-binding protein
MLRKVRLYFSFACHSRSRPPPARRPKLSLHIRSRGAQHSWCFRIVRAVRFRLRTFLLGQAMEIGRPYSRLLCRLERFGPLSLQDRRRISELPFKVTNFAANQEITHQSNALSHCTLVLGGFLYRHKAVGGSRRQITSFLVPGDIADLQTLYLPSLDHGVSALGAAVVAFVPHAAIKDMLEASAQLTHAFWRETFVESAIFREWVTNLGQREAIARVAHVVCELTLRLQAVDLARDLCFSIPWTQADLADACGISSVHANRVVQELRRLGLIDWGPKQIRIRDWDRLVRFGDFSDHYLQMPDAAKGALSAYRALQTREADQQGTGISGAIA